MRLLILFLTLLFAGCSNDNVAGNSSETGNCRIIGVASFTSELPADSVPVVLTPANYTAVSVSTPDTVWTNEYGEYHFDSVAPGEWTVSVVAPEVNEGLIRQGISLDFGDTISVDGELQLLGTVEVSRFDVRDTIVVSVVGTPWSAIIPAGEYSVQIPALPSTEPLSLEIHTQNGNSLYKEELQVPPGGSVEMVYQKTLLVLHGEGEENLYGLYKTVFDQAGFRSESRSVDTGMIAEYGEYDVIFMVGNPYINSELSEFLVATEVSIVTAVPISFPLLFLTQSNSAKNYGTTSTGQLYILPDNEVVEESGLPEDMWLDVSNGELMSYGLPTGGGVNIGTISTNGLSGLFIYEKGAALASGIASGRRAVIFANGVTLTENGEKLLVSTVLWAGRE